MTKGRSVTNATIRYLRLNGGDPLPELDGLSPYKAIVVIEEDVSSQWQAQASRWFADSGCRFMMAWGRRCSAWHDCVDEANLERFDFSEIPDADFIMTTWHEDEPLKEVFWFAKIAAHHPTLELKNVVLLHISSIDRENEFLGLLREA